MTYNTLDFRHTGWGHNISLIENHGDGVLEYFTWSTPGPKVGDMVLWETELGHCVAEVTESEWTKNVSDMYRIKVQVTERYHKDGTKVENI